MKKRGLTPRELRFCACYADSGDSVHSALSAGYSHPEESSAALLIREDINQEIARIYSARSRNCRQRARAGYERLAFGNITDAVRLMFETELSGVALESYDLFNVAEIKRPREGAMEIRFFDRIKALEKLEASDEGAEKNVSEFYRALKDSVEASSDRMEEEGIAVQ